MSTKILASEGLSSRPLTLLERAVELARTDRYGREGPLAHAGRFALYAGAPSSLSRGSVLQVEDLAPTMQCVAFDKDLIV